ncbi:MAG: histidine kinase [Chlorobiaceae bacterium]|nr:histidine kinase [Chlorobiaceae bacterium]MBA4309109.1 histidine kinase [Chlorobiaceae bacterium]
MNTTIVDLLSKKEKTIKVLNNVYNLPLIPKIILDVSKLLENESVKNNELVKVISKDQGLVTKILTIANSPMYGLARKVSTIDFAILVLGINEIRSIVSALAIIESFKNKSDKYLDQAKFWTHCFITGTAAKRLAEEFGIQKSGEAFVAGLLHDVGISVIHRFFHSSFIQITELVEKSEYSYADAELEVLGMSHSEVAYYLLEKWNFPTALSESVLFHHTPMKSLLNPPLSAVIHFADYVTHCSGIGDFPWDINYKFDEAVLGVLKVDYSTTIDTIVESYKPLFQKQLEFLKI